jgi:tryptophan-rich sensory protein
MDFPIRDLPTLVLIFVGIAVIVNLFSLSYSRSQYREYKNLPPGYIIGIIWIVLIGCMAYAQSLVLSLSKKKWIEWLIPSLFLYCVLYPFYTNAFRNEWISQIANVGSVLLSLFIAIFLYSISIPVAGGLIGLTTIWSAYATYTTWKPV